MCGRYALYTEPSLIRDAFGLSTFLDYKPHYNISPGAYLPLITSSGACLLMRWGFVPHWQAGDKPRYINARSEDAQFKPAFRDAWRTGRGLVLASGFYEWRQIGALKQPYFVRFEDDKPFAMAGIWAQRGKAESQDLSFAILTQKSQGPLAEFHDRMPIVLSQGQSQNAWLQTGELTEDLALWPADCLLYPVHTRVNHPKFNEPACIVRLR